MWHSAAQLTIIGMGVVFFFLAFLATAVSLLGTITLRFFPEKPAVPQQSAINDNLIAAIIAAVASKY
ncbi:oxaloacetate decarboxylase gamma chain [Candidatus Termititenax persephonae]|uniref:Oxaloacetate decarboxylase gamma chain n=1 Tax=Candidatus Termititenax persephonae TaxID=2218525 RepID=A0A388TGY7_9BACT|nr:oxaloacetate decarboxylase gamma chain [Candidatus Termititenax persephonae]